MTLNSSEKKIDPGSMYWRCTEIMCKVTFKEQEVSLYEYTVDVEQLFFHCINNSTFITVTTLHCSYLGIHKLSMKL